MAPSEPTPVQQPDGGAERCRTCGSPMCCGAPNFGAAIPPASPEREAVYRAVDAWLDTIDKCCAAALLSGPLDEPYRSAQKTDSLAHIAFAEACSRYRSRQVERAAIAARKESVDEK